MLQVFHINHLDKNLMLQVFHINHLAKTLCYKYFTLIIWQKPYVTSISH